jgi:hypothetical protein
MPVGIELGHKDMARLQDVLAAAGDDWLTVGKRIALEATELMEMTTKREIVAKDLVFRGTLLNSIASHVGIEGSGASQRIIGTVFSDLPHAEVMELGRSSGSMPPVDALIPWVRKKFKGKLFAPIVTHATKGRAKAKTAELESQVRSMSFALARSIKRKGITGRGYFKRAAEVVESKLAGIAERVLRDFVGGG